MSDAIWRPSEKDLQVFVRLSLEIGSGSFGLILRVGVRER